MFLLKGHGTNSVLYGDTSSYGGRAMSAEAACGFVAGTYPGAPTTGPFDYLFPDAASPPDDAAAMTKALDDLGRGQIHHLLRNQVYIGRIRQKETTWPGRHDALLDIAVWERVQEKVQAASARPRGRSASHLPRAPLTGKLRDEIGDRLTPSHTTRNGRRLRY